VCTPEGDSSLLVQDPSQQQLQGPNAAPHAMSQSAPIGAAQNLFPLLYACLPAAPQPPRFVVVIFYKLSLGMNELPAASARGLLKRVRHTKGSAQG